MQKNWCIIDDDEAFHFTTELMLSKQEVTTRLDSFTDGKQAIEFIQKNLNQADMLPDIILLDLYMPKMDGWDFMNALTEIEDQLPKNVSIYVVTSSVDDQDYKKLRTIERVKNYYVKPIDRYMIREILSDQVTN